MNNVLSWIEVSISNAIRKREKPLELRFSRKIWLYFNGSKLSLYRGNQVIDYFNAYSGKALSIEVVL